MVKVEPVRRNVPRLLRPYHILTGPVARLVKIHEKWMQFLEKGEEEREREKEKEFIMVFVKSGKLRVDAIDVVE